MLRHADPSTCNHKCSDRRYVERMAAIATSAAGVKQRFTFLGNFYMDHSMAHFLGESIQFVSGFPFHFESNKESSNECDGRFTAKNKPHGVFGIV